MRALLAVARNQRRRPLDHAGALADADRGHRPVWHYPVAADIQANPAAASQLPAGAAEYSSMQARASLREIGLVSPFRYQVSDIASCTGSEP
jgi:hypothetical protein